MKPMKASRTVKSSKGRSPVKKFQSSRKPGPARSPQRMAPSRSSGMLGPQSGMKRPSTSSRSSKPSHSRGFGSPQRMSPRKNRRSLSMDRGHGMKERRIASGPRIPESRNSPQMHASHYGPLPKKKARRETGYTELPSPSRYPLHKSSEKSHSRAEADSHRRSTASSAASGYDHGKKFVDSPSKGRPLHDSSREGYGVPLPSSSSSVREKSLMSSDMSYHPRDQFLAPKHGREQSLSAAYSVMDKSKNYGLTLDERFRTVSSDSARARAEQQTQYSREELENITIDIKRSMREYSPTIRRIIDPSEVKLVRRPGEGHRPLFDREEIKQASRDLREDAHFEQKMYSRGSGHYSFNYKDMENYEITRHKFDSYHGPALHTEGAYTLSEKWQRLDSKKSEMTIAEREGRNRNYPDRPHGEYEKKYGPRSLSADSDFRFGVVHRSRGAYETDLRKPIPPQADMGFKEVFQGERNAMDRRGRDREPYSGSQPWYPSMVRHPSDVLPSRGRGEPREKNSEILDRPRSPRDPWIDDRYYDRAHSKEEKFIPSSHKTGRPKYPPYSDKPPEMPRAPSFHEYDGRGSPRNQRSLPSRGSSRGFRSRPARGRLSKAGTSRGFRGRNPYSGGPGARGRAFLARRRPSGSYPMD